MDGSAANDIRKLQKHWNTAIDLAAHFISTLLLAWFFYQFTGRWTWAILAILGGIFIDLDHVIDYFLYYGWKFDLKAFFESKYLASGKTYLIFHSWEEVLLLWGGSFVVSWMIPLAAGVTLHLIIDALYSHRTNPLFLSLAYRWYNKFNLDKIDSSNFFKINGSIRDLMN